MVSAMRWSGAACAQPMALEIVCGKDRLVTGCGWTPRAADRQGLRLTPGHSTLTLGEISTGEPLGGWKADLLRVNGFDEAERLLASGTTASHISEASRLQTAAAV